MIRSLPLLFLLVVAPPLCADVHLKLPPEVKGEPGDFLTVKAETNGAVVRWVALDAGLKVFPAELLKDTRSTVVTATAPGRYRVLAYTALGDEPSLPALCLVVIAAQPKPAPLPDAFAADLQRLYSADQAADKDQSRTALAAVFRHAAQSTVHDTRLRTCGELQQTLREASQSLLAVNALRFVRERIAEELAKTLPLKPDTPLDPAARADCRSRLHPRGPHPWRAYDDRVRVRLDRRPLVRRQRPRIDGTSSLRRGSSAPARQ